MLPTVYRTDGSGGSRGGPPRPPSLFLDHTEARRAKKSFETGPHLISGSGWPWIRHWTVRHWNAFAMGGKLWVSLRYIPSWKSLFCCMLDTNVWFLCLFVFRRRKKQQTNNTMMFAVESKGWFQIINIDPEGNKKRNEILILESQFNLF